MNLNKSKYALFLPLFGICLGVFLSVILDNMLGWADPSNTGPTLLSSWFILSASITKYVVVALLVAVALYRTNESKNENSFYFESVKSFFKTFVFSGLFVFITAVLSGWLGSIPEHGVGLSAVMALNTGLVFAASILALKGLSKVVE